MVGINHFRQPDFDMQAQFDHVLHAVETPQNCRGGFENTLFSLPNFLYEDCDIKNKQKI